MQIDFDGEKNTITVDDVTISLEALKTIVNPDPSSVHRFVRIGNVVRVTTRRSPKWLFDA